MTNEIDNDDVVEMIGDELDDTLTARDQHEKDLKLLQDVVNGDVEYWEFVFESFHSLLSR